MRSEKEFQCNHDLSDLSLMSVSKKALHPSPEWAGISPVTLGELLKKEKNKNKFHINVATGLNLITIAIYELIMYIYRTMESRYKVKAGKAAI